MKNETSIKILQYYATNLAAQSNAHKVQGKVFAAQGFSALGSKYAEHATEEMGNVDKFIDRIIDLVPVVMDKVDAFLAKQNKES